MYHSQKLVNKLMSRSYFEYNLAETKKKEPDTIKVSLPQEEPDDLGVLNGFLNPL